MKSYLILAFILFSVLASAQIIKPGEWRGEIVYSEVSVPFTFEVQYVDGQQLEVTVINGDETLVFDTFVEGDTLIIPLTPYDTEIRTSFGAMEMKGTFNRSYRGISYSFQANYGKSRFQKRSILMSPLLESKWKMTIGPDGDAPEMAVGLFERKGIRVTGTVLTEVSDYRYFEGILDGDSLMLSAFDGTHAFLLTGKKSADGWRGELHYDDGYKEDWLAVPDEAFELRDPFEIVTLTKGEHKPYYDLLAAGSTDEGKINPKAYEGKVVLLQSFGTWCPNSYDQTQFLVDWAKTKPDEVEIIASSYEVNYSQAYGLERIASYKEANKIPYEVVLGGRRSKTSAAIPFPFMSRIEAFPTLVFIDKQGYARYVLSYFNGPATGAYFQAFKDRFDSIVKELVDE